MFAHLWIDFAMLGKDTHPDPDLQVNWWDNSVQAAWASWQFAVDHHDDVVCDGDDDFTTYQATSWGLTAAEGPDGDYHAYGAEPAATVPDHDGTIAPYGAGSALMMLPEKSIPALEQYFSGSDLWRYRFGFGDAYNLDPAVCGNPWYSHAGFGIDQGPLLIGIENYRSRLVWDILKQSEDIWPTICSIIPLRFDFNGNGQVDVLDINSAADHWGCHAGNVCYAPEYDGNSDGQIDIIDIQSVAARWGEVCGPS
jgi:hypothetical protein